MGNNSSQLYIGLMSGTSLDGVDAVIADLSNSQPRLLSQYFEPYPKQLLASVKELCRHDQVNLDQLGQTDAQLGEFYAHVVKQLLDKSPLCATDIIAIGSHGQTIQHSPSTAAPYTIQLGDPNRLSELTGICVVADFRRKDIAAGGQGAPLVPAFHQAAFHTKNANRAILNIGGIANISYLAADNSVAISGFDCGPGNTLMDQFCQAQLNCQYDKDGILAKSGKINLSLLKQLLADDYFQQAAPKSTGPEHFNLNWLNQHTKSDDMKSADVLATLCELSAQSIANSLNQLASLDEVLLCGGGIHNGYLLERISQLSKAPVYSSEKYGVAPDWVEAMAFAWLAMRTINGLTGNIPSVTGATREVVLGAIYSR